MCSSDLHMGVDVGGPAPGLRHDVAADAGHGAAAIGNPCRCIMRAAGTIERDARRFRGDAVQEDGLIFCSLQEPVHGRRPEIAGNQSDYDLGDMAGLQVQ